MTKLLRYWYWYWVILQCFRDFGIGIAQEDIPLLTKRFYRVDSARSRESGNTGLGLSIVKHIINRHQGELIIESELDLGSHFTASFKK